MKIVPGIRKSACALVLVVVAHTGLAQSNGTAEQDLLKIQEAWATARTTRDVPYLERLYAREFRVQAMNGSVVSREADIANFATGDLKPDYVRDEEMTVAVYGDTALVTGVEHVGGRYKGRTGEFSLRFANVFVKRDQRWQLVLHQATPIPRQ